MFLLHFSFPLVSGPSRMQNQKRKERKKKETKFRLDVKRPNCITNENEMAKTPHLLYMQAIAQTWIQKNNNQRAFFFISYSI